VPGLQVYAANKAAKAAALRGNTISDRALGSDVRASLFRPVIVLWHEKWAHTKDN